MRRWLFVLFLAWVLPAVASYPLTQNFTRKQYGGGTQVWHIAQDSVGRMYFGNKSGLLVYNGRDWNLTHLPNGSTVRCSYFDEKSGRLYIGASEDFGYFEPDKSTHVLKYVSLAESLGKNKSVIREVWNIYTDNDNVWFQADNCIFRMTGQRIHILSLPGKITASALIDGILYVAVEGKGIHEVRGSQIVPVRGCGQISDKRVIGLLKLGGYIIAVTRDSGLYSLRAEGVVAMPTSLDSFLKHSQVFCAASNGMKMAFGSVLDGVAVMDFATGQVSRLNRTTGLQNNTVLSLFFDRDENLWLGLDDGIDKVSLNSAFFDLLGNSSEYGAGYAAHYHDGRLYLGTNHGLFVMDYPRQSSASQAGLPMALSGQVWSVSSAGDKVFVSGDSGLFYGENLSFTRVEGISGAWECQLLSDDPSRALVSTYDGFYILRRQGDRWINDGRIGGLADIGGRFVQDSDGGVWVSHWLKGLYYFTIDVENVKVSSSSFYNHRNGLPTDRNNNVQMVNGRLVFGTEGGFFRFDGKKFHQDVELGKLLGMFEPGRLIDTSAGDVWCVADKNVIRMSRQTDGKMMVDSTSYSYCAPHLIPGFEKLEFLPDNHLIIAVQEGFYDVNLRHRINRNPSVSLFFEKVYINGDSLIASSDFSGRLPAIRLSHLSNTLAFEFAMTSYDPDIKPRYSCRLEHYDKGWSPYMTSGRKEYTQLKPGDYVMHVRAILPGMTSPKETALAFTITPPWYLSRVAQIIYLLLIVGVAIGLHHAIKWLISRQSRRIENQQAQEIEHMRRVAHEESLEKDYEIAHLKGQQLELDVKHKAEELSNLTHNMARKNEILLDISEGLKMLQKSEMSSEAGKQLRRLQALIRENISHDDDWKNFVHNFDAAYEDFTKKLLDRHPSLTITDLRTCCYIKMGLSSKEIAPLFNISYRSVEMNRYRLRKKLELERNENLSEYLMKI